MPTIRQATVEENAIEIASLVGPKLDKLKVDPRERAEYSPELAETILHEIAKGRSLIAVCNQEGMPHHVSFLKWCQSLPDLAERYVLAKKLRAHANVEQVSELTETLDPVNTGKTEAYVSDIKAKNLLRLAELGDPAAFSPKMMHSHSHSGGVVTITMDLGAPQPRQIIDTTASQVPETPQLSAPQKGEEVEKADGGGPSQPEVPGSDSMGG